MKPTSSILSVLVFISLFSCDKTRVFDEYKSVGSAWNRDSIVKFDLPKLEPTKKYNLFINLRNNDNYPFNNMFLLVALENPDGLIKVDTLEYEMANLDGMLLGEGFSDTKESKLFYKENLKFDKKGVYKVRIQQAVRQNGKVAGVKELNGVTEVGFRIESIK
ncbi:MAG: gliding motility lipoprotein GldH [Flavobacterium sp.]|nr:gliding motility lipoprotein GldH [Flavobacterium sp.]